MAKENILIALSSISPNGEYYAREYTRFEAESINSTFRFFNTWTWRHSPQGHNFWANIREKMYKKKRRNAMKYLFSVLSIILGIILLYKEEFFIATIAFLLPTIIYILWEEG